MSTGPGPLVISPVPAGGARNGCLARPAGVSKFLTGRIADDQIQAIYVFRRGR